MSRYFPHPPYAEDQPLSHTILTVHVLGRGYTTGAVVGLGALSVGSLYKRIRGVAAAKITATTSSTAPTLRATGVHRVLRSTGTASLIGMGLMGLALAGRMQGREDIEWRDRAWRLLENAGQVETDDWTVGGTVAGLVGLGVWRQAGGAAAAGGARVVAGAAGLGSVVGTVGYLAWRYGVHKGRFPAYVAAEEAAL
ncbi:hypothetical protein CPLU01_10574 [Colletotrichum plurivorum]|uniref:Uncharacterized protein n=1 Tax=Colletotrichum plurivorum TaxID=2175906 RepID=A0A8H6NA04_9PEZI|nr:hypothetical protein CPLU01_10574 [Colletotrichum plurivorum]